MSGPKVVRVVTREELQAICRRQIAVVDAAIKELARIIRQYELPESELEKAFLTRRNALATLLDNGSYAALQKQGAALLDHCRAEAVRLERKAIAAIEAAKARRRRVSDGARSIFDALTAAGIAPPADLYAIVGTSLTADDEMLRQQQKIVESAFRLFVGSGKASTALTDQQKSLALRLGGGEEVQTFAAWQAAQVEQVDPQAARLDKVLSEVESLGDAAVIEEFGKRAALIAREPALSQRRLLTDSFVLDASNRLKMLKEEAALRTQLRELHGVLCTYGDVETTKVAESIATALASPKTLDKTLISTANAAIDQAQRKLAAVARRRAILAGLATLGYEVRENMATAWARDGRLVVRKPGATDYGVEFAAPEDAARLQVRLVGAQSPAQPRGVARDRDQEATWCSEFGELRKLVAKAGGDLQIERAKEVGAEAVKTIPFDDVIAAEHVDARRPLEKRL